VTLHSTPARPHQDLYHHFA